jgi:type II secretion system protein N
METDAGTIHSPSNARLKKGLGILGWVSLSLSLIITFTVAKLPDQQIGQILLSNVNRALQQGPMHLEISAQKTRISLFPLPGLRLEEITLKTRDPSGNSVRIRWAMLKIRPALLDLLMGRVGATVAIHPQPDQPAAIEASFWGTKDAFSVSATFDRADLGEGGAGLLPLLARVSGKLPLSGTLRLSGDPQQLSGWNGSIQLDLDAISLPAQKIAGFQAPALAIRGGSMRIQIANSRAKVENLRLGKISEAGDDLAGTLSGEVTLGKSWDASQLGLSAKLRISEALNKAFFLIDALLASSKTPDGSYSFTLTGPTYAPVMAPTTAPAGS